MAGAGSCFECPADTYSATAGAVACDQVQRASRALREKLDLTDASAVRCDGSARPTPSET